jgi:hypothetical protein
LKRKTSTGHAALIKVNGEAKCGGAAVKMSKKLLAVNLESMKARKTRMTRLEIPKKKTSKNSRRM